MTKQPTILEIESDSEEQITQATHIQTKKGTKNKCRTRNRIDNNDRLNRPQPDKRLTRNATNDRPTRNNRRARNRSTTKTRKGTVPNWISMATLS